MSGSPRICINNAAPMSCPSLPAINDCNKKGKYVDGDPCLERQMATWISRVCLKRRVRWLVSRCDRNRHYHHHSQKSEYIYFIMSSIENTSKIRLLWERLSVCDTGSCGRRHRR